jgi:hypothetical protein
VLGRSVDREGLRGGSRTWRRGNRAAVRAVFAIYLVGPLIGLALYIVIGFLGR